MVIDKWSGLGPDFRETGRGAQDPQERRHVVRTFLAGPDLCLRRVQDEVKVSAAELKESGWQPRPGFAVNTVRMFINTCSRSLFTVPVRI